MSRYGWPIVGPFPVGGVTTPALPADGHAAAVEIQTGPPQQVLTRQIEPAGHELPAPHEAPQGVPDGTQKPRPSAVEAQMQLALPLQLVNVVQVLPAHSGLMPGVTPCAPTCWATPRIVGAAYAAPPIFSPVLITSRRSIALILTSGRPVSFSSTAPPPLTYEPRFDRRMPSGPIRTE